MSKSTGKAKPATSWAFERLNGADLSPTGESFLIRASCPLRRQVEKGGTVHDLDAILGVNLAVSRQHAEVYLGGEGGIGIVDRGSRNGTFVKRVDPTKGDDAKLKANIPCILAAGDIFSIGPISSSQRDSQKDADPKKRTLVFKVVAQTDLSVCFSKLNRTERSKLIAATNVLGATIAKDMNAAQLVVVNNFSPTVKILHAIADPDKTLVTLDWFDFLSPDNTANMGKAAVRIPPYADFTPSGSGSSGGWNDVAPPSDSRSALLTGYAVLLAYKEDEKWRTLLELCGATAVVGYAASGSGNKPPKLASLLQGLESEYVPTVFFDDIDGDNSPQSPLCNDAIKKHLTWLTSGVLARAVIINESPKNSLLRAKSIDDLPVAAPKHSRAGGSGTQQGTQASTQATISSQVLIVPDDDDDDDDDEGEVVVVVKEEVPETPDAAPRRSTRASSSRTSAAAAAAAPLPPPSSGSRGTRASARSAAAKRKRSIDETATAAAADDLFKDPVPVLPATEFEDEDDAAAEKQKSGSKKQRPAAASKLAPVPETDDDSSEKEEATPPPKKGSSNLRRKVDPEPAPPVPPVPEEINTERAERETEAMVVDSEAAPSSPPRESSSIGEEGQQPTSTAAEAGGGGDGDNAAAWIDASVSQQPLMAQEMEAEPTPEPVLEPVPEKVPAKEVAMEEEEEEDEEDDCASDGWLSAPSAAQRRRLRVSAGLPEVDDEDTPVIKTVRGFVMDKEEEASLQKAIRAVTYRRPPSSSKSSSSSSNESGSLFVKTAPRHPNDQRVFRKNYVRVCAPKDRIDLNAPGMSVLVRPGDGDAERREKEEAAKMERERNEVVLMGGESEEPAEVDAGTFAEDFAVPILPTSGGGRGWR